jgi:hypothetical protein
MVYPLKPYVCCLSSDCLINSIAPTHISKTWREDTHIRTIREWAIERMEVSRKKRKFVFKIILQKYIDIN